MIKIFTRKKKNLVFVLILILIFFSLTFCKGPQWTKTMKGSPKLSFVVCLEKDYGKFLKLPNNYISEINNLLQEKKFISRIIPFGKVKKYFLENYKSGPRLKKVKEHARKNDDFVLMIEILIQQEFYLEKEGTYAFKAIAKSTFYNVNTGKSYVNKRNVRYYVRDRYHYINDVMNRFKKEIEYLIHEYVENYDLHK